MMPPKSLPELEQVIRNLPREEQLWLVERIIHHLRVQSTHSDVEAHRVSLEQQLTDMANDPAIQIELRAINQEFAAAEMDGLQQL
jgi:hypothetical protein